jgi:hypothetical protein
VIGLPLQYITVNPKEVLLMDDLSRDVSELMLAL